MHRRTPLARPVLAGLAAATLLLSGCSAEPQVASGPAVVDGPVALTPSEVPSPSAGADLETPTPSPTPTASPTPVKPRFSYDVAAVQRTLKDLNYYGGSVDGSAGAALRSAVMAFQKVNGLGADGAVGPATLKALKAPKAPSLRGSSPANRVEVDLTKQVAYVVKSGAVARILPVSSGNGATYEQKDGSSARALTPVGYYKVQRRIVGERKADLGTLYDPQYFYRGWAIHGSNSVPAGPASHGCVRVTRADAKYLLDAISVGTSVYLYGGKHTFTAGSGAPGTDAPTGDTAADTKPEPTATPAPKPASSGSPRPSRPSSSPSASPSSTATAKPGISAAPSPSATPAPPAR